MDKRRIFLPLSMTVICLCLQVNGFALEERKGVIQRTTDPVCNLGCGAFYLEPDASYAFIYLRGFDFFPYLGKHVQIIGTKGSCGGCTVLDVVSIVILPTVGVEEPGAIIPRELALHQNYPNPFNPLTKITYAIPSSQQVSLTIYDVLGQTVVELINRAEQLGQHTVTWDAGNIPAGVYVYRLRTTTGTLVKRMVLIR